MGGNKLGNHGCKLISQINFPVIETLYLCMNLIKKGNNEIDSTGVQHLSKIQLKTLKQIYLSDNKIT